MKIEFHILFQFHFCSVYGRKNRAGRRQCIILGSVKASFLVRLKFDVSAEGWELWVEFSWQNENDFYTFYLSLKVKTFMFIWIYWSGKMGTNCVQRRQVKQIHARAYKITWIETNLKWHFLRYLLRVKSVNQVRVNKNRETVKRLWMVLERIWSSLSKKHKINSLKYAEENQLDLTFQE